MARRRKDIGFFYASVKWYTLLARDVVYFNNYFSSKWFLLLCSGIYKTHLYSWKLIYSHSRECQDEKAAAALCVTAVTL